MIPKDKILHFSVGAVASFVTYMTVLKYTDNPIKSAIFSILAAVLIGLLKEIYDQWKYKGFSFMDWIATVLGGLFMTIILYLSIQIETL